MTILLATANAAIGETGAYFDLLQKALPDMAVYWPKDLEEKPELAKDIRYAVVWQPPPGLLATLLNLQAILNLGAGVDALLRQPDFPKVTLTRLADAGMGPQMAEYCLYGVLRFHRRMDDYTRLQARQSWQELPAPRTNKRRVGILGLGVLGQQVAQAITPLGFPVTGWSRSQKNIPGVKSVYGLENLPDFLNTTDILINLLPLTPDTRGILNRDTLYQLPSGACLINVARGAHVVDQDLIDALDNGHLRGAMLDVFAEEPLPAEHPFWRHPAIKMTPHVSAQTLPEEAIRQVADNIHRLENGQPPLNAVDLSKGY